MDAVLSAPWVPVSVCTILPRVSRGNVTANVSMTNTTNVGVTFATSSLPLVPAGYIKVNLNGTVVLVPYYAQ